MRFGIISIDLKSKPWVQFSTHSEAEEYLADCERLPGGDYRNGSHLYRIVEIPEENKAGK